MKKIIFVLFLYLFTLSVAAQQEEILTIEYNPQQKTFFKSDTIIVHGILRIAEQWHVNAHQPADSNLIGTDVQLHAMPGFRLLAIDYPRAVKLQTGYDPLPLWVYADGAEVTIFLKAEDYITPGEYKILVQTEYQACNNVTCMPPRINNSEFILKISQ
ncbi:MAG: hypothetical protein LWX56_06770 [Ignavibacteria bacterium]|nr:hypothetical protein [Ignavibacteria bacterium]